MSYRTQFYRHCRREGFTWLYLELPMFAKLPVIRLGRTTGRRLMARSRRNTLERRECSRLLKAGYKRSRAIGMAMLKYRSALHRE